MNRLQRIAVSTLEINSQARKAAPFALAILLALTVLPTAHAQTFIALHTFSGQPDGREPIAGLTRDRSGNLYGTTVFGGAHDMGFIFRVAHKGSGWVMTPLYSFQGGNDGANPVGGLTIAPDGNLYGTVSGGGQHGAGMVYKLSAPASFSCRSLFCPWTKTPLYQFTGGADGGTPIYAHPGQRRQSLWDCQWWHRKWGRLQTDPFRLRLDRERALYLRRLPRW